MKKNLPVLAIKNNRIRNSNKTIFCFAYQEDLDQAYAFYCSRYENISYREFLNLGFFEFKKKIGSIPKSEPLYDIIKSRTIELGKIKDKEERKYWRELKRINQIPQIFISTDEIFRELKGRMKETKQVGGK